MHNADAQAVVARLLSDDCPPFALLHRRTPGHTPDTVEVLIGPADEVERLTDIPLPLAELLDALPAHDVRVEDGRFDVGDDAYADIVSRVIEDEIGTGEGANFVIRRTFEGGVDRKST